MVIMMIEGLSGRKFVVGVKQSSQLVEKEECERVFVAEDTDDDIRAPFEILCRKNKVPVHYVPTKKELGKACGIDVDASFAAIIKQGVNV